MIDKGTADLTLTQDAGNGNGADGSESSSNCGQSLVVGLFTDSKTSAQAMLNIVGTLYLAARSNSPPVL
jgi:hypothetical protein